MKIVSVLLALTLLSTPFELLAGTRPSEGQQDSQLPSYRYGMHLDIKEVLSRQALSTDCGLTSMVMTYMDSTGEEQQLAYKDYQPCPGEFSQ